MFKFHHLDDDCISSIQKISVHAHSMKETCELAGPEASILLEWSNVFTNPKELKRRATINIFKHMDIIEKDFNATLKFY